MRYRGPTKRKVLLHPWLKADPCDHGRYSHGELAVGLPDVKLSFGRASLARFQSSKAADGELPRLFPTLSVAKGSAVRGRQARPVLRTIVVLSTAVFVGCGSDRSAAQVPPPGIDGAAISDGRSEVPNCTTGTILTALTAAELSTHVENADLIGL